MQNTERFFAPTNAQIYGIANVYGQTVSWLLDDIAQITFSTPVDVKPVLSLGQREQIGYTYGQRLYAGTIQVPANSYPSFFNLFTTWLTEMYTNYSVRNKDNELSQQIENNTGLYMNVNAEDLPFFDIQIISLPETSSDNLYNAFVYLMKDVKIIETSVDLNTQSPTSQVMFYRFTQRYIGQKLALLKQDNNIVNLSTQDLLKVVDIYDDTKNYQSFTSTILKNLYFGKQQTGGGA